MDIKLNADQVEIARQARRFCENETPIEYARKMFEDPKGYTDEIWGKMVEMGWTAMCIPEDYDGLGLELMDLAVVVEEMGRIVAPGPFFSSTVLAGEVLKAAGDSGRKSSYLSRMAAGEIKGALAMCEAEGGGDPEYINLTARPDGDGFILNGCKAPVPDAHTADFLICAARTAAGAEATAGITLFLVDLPNDGLKVTPLPAMDGTRKPCAVEFDNLRLGADTILGNVNRGWDPLGKALQRAWVIMSAECVGGAQRAMEIATAYAKERVQFDQPIACFQSIKHMCAQMYVETESARSLLYWAAWAQDHADAKEAAVSASVSKSYCADAYRNAAAKAIQILGGTGMTWEHDIHLYIKRSKANELSLGDRNYHRERVVRLLTA